MLLLTSNVYAQFAIKGNVADEKGNPLIGANILIKENNKGTVSDENGNFNLADLPKGTYSLAISFMGYKSVEKNISLENSDAAMIVKLVELSTYLSAIEVFAPKEMPFTSTIITKKDLAKVNIAQDMPILLQYTPSVVSMSDGGAGVGYTNMRIRGSDNTRTNVTINGIPVNDAESQGVWWVNMPDFASSLEAVQIQRGIGTSVNGSGAFGASINLSTSSPSEKAYFEVGNTYGSFNTWKHNIRLGTGTINKYFSIDARLSKVSTDGYINNAWAKLKSFYVSSAFKKNGTKLTLNVFGGKETTFQSWNGVSQEKIDAGERTFNELAAYNNEVDDYQQDHYQLIFDQKLSNTWQLYSALHYTRGLGYFEQYKADQKLKNYGLQPIAVKDSLIQKTDLIRRRWLDNHFYGALANVSYNSLATKGSQSALVVNLGASFNRYSGKHFGEVIWAKTMSNGDIRHRYYDNDASKTEMNFFAKAQYQFTEGFYGFIDGQLRTVDYTFLGYNNELKNVTQTANFAFFNPKLGLRYVKAAHEFYISFARASREPNRDDFTQSSAANRPTFETMNNLEAGWQTATSRWALSANYYLMNYENQLILTGKINDVGAYTRQNVAQSYRQGIELAASFKPTTQINLFANATFSQNVIRNYTEYLDAYDNDWNPIAQTQTVYEKTNIAFSPSTMGNLGIEYSPAPRLTFAFTNKYVGKQFLDNTSSDSRKIDAFYVGDFRLNYGVNIKGVSDVTLTLLVNNVFNAMYAPNGYTYGWQQGGSRTSVNYYYPQAGRNFLLGVNIKF
jgi:iron complex outermembrane receptor protein